jgi:hypothetical protein
MDRESVVWTDMTHALRHGGAAALLLLAACEPRSAWHHRGRQPSDDPVARLLDRQTALALTGGQVTQLIALHETMRAKERPIQERIHSLIPDARGERRRLSEVPRESIGTLVDMLHEIHWRAESSADSLLSDEQRRTAARLAVDQDVTRPAR